MKKFIFTDFAGNKFFLTEEDNYELYVKRKSITDAVNIINYILNKTAPLDILVDFGANLGGVTMAMWHNACMKGHTGRVYSVEADPYNIKNCIII